MSIVSHGREPGEIAKIRETHGKSVRLDGFEVRRLYTHSNNLTINLIVENVFLCHVFLSCVYVTVTFLLFHFQRSHFSGDSFFVVLTVLPSDYTCRQIETINWPGEKFWSYCSNKFCPTCIHTPCQLRKTYG